ncbi:protein of unknown function [Blastococcus saxobsidens DD2]|uniref:Uncharacterized protein n=1 Tax=Blastococcus saxobsidens (strain DD2) TaxID=1146883 RepID=H6RJT1_BLASD|nr:protein of unknown function [Blastococcus saxobsidens DD2]
MCAGAPFPAVEGGIGHALPPGRRRAVSPAPRRRRPVAPAGGLLAVRGADPRAADVRR